MKQQWTKRKLFKFSIITIVLILLVLEIVFRIVFAIQYKGYHTSLYVQGNTVQMNDSALVFRNRPFYLGYLKEFQYNEEGMRSKRGDVFMPEKGADDFWVFLFGGSAMEGMGSNKDGKWFDITGVPDYRPHETIAGILQETLQKQMPQKKVRVFNAANSGFTILQSIRRYELLAEKYQMDWVISMDGENEPPELKEGQSVDNFIRERWHNTQVFRFPLKIVVPLTSHSAFIYSIKQMLYDLKYAARVKNIEKNNYPERTAWANAASGSIRFASSNEKTERALNAFYASLHQFDSVLTARSQRHLLYIQPHLAFRDTSAMNTTERALLNYYVATYNDPFNNLFKRKILLETDSISPNIKSLNKMLSLKEPVFVDYCHFTIEANRYIAEMIAKEILRNVP